MAAKTRPNHSSLPRSRLPRSRLRLVFDLDDTLYPERQFAVSGFRACAGWLARDHGVATSDNVVEHMTRLLDDGHMRALFEIVLGDNIGAYSPATLEAFIDIYRLHEPEISFYHDTEDVLAHYEARGPLGLITDGQPEVQSSKVRALGLEPRFAHIVYTSGLGGRAFAKPHPRAFEVTEAALGQPGDRFVYVGDNPAKDFVAPNLRGWTTVQVLRPQRIHARAKMAEGGAAQHVVETLAALPDLLGE